MSQAKLITVFSVLIIVGILSSFSLFTVKQWEKAILFQIGEIRETQFEPGLHIKIPMLQSVKKFDGRILTLEISAERFLTKEKKNVIVDSFVKWRILDVAKFYTSVGGKEEDANNRLMPIINKILREEFANRDIQQIISGDRKEIRNVLIGGGSDKTKVDPVNISMAAAQAKQLGIQLVDVLIKRVDLPEDVSDAVYRRMEIERKQAANMLRSTGFEEAEQVRADADKQVKVLVSGAYRDAENIRGQGDAKASEIYAKAYSENPEFYAFYRSLTAYKASFNSKQDILLIQPQTEFFKYYRDTKAK